ncbi:MAG: ABC transporter substrate-binding protein [Deltaproteobacteria bacterium]|nr:ABC transporter substrate-binding protein [Deltaproteobacteria bacterium]
MSEKKSKIQPNGLTRRDFLKKTGVAGAALGAATVVPGLARKALAAKRDYILIGHPNPSTGPLAGFGEASPWADNKAIEAINKQGGIYIKEYGKKVPIKLKMLDTESNPTKAAELAAKLIVKDKIDLMVVMHTPDTVNPVDAMCERYKMPCISLDAPVGAWLTGGAYKWCFHAFWTVDTVTDLFAGMWETYAAQTTKVVGGFWPNDPDGVAWSGVFKDKLPKMGYKVVDPGRFPYFNKDFSSIINLFKKEKVEIITGTLIAPDWTTAWKQCHQQGFIPKMATIAKACLFATDVNALGENLPNGLTTEVWWSPNHPFKSSLTGESAKDLCDAWTKEANKAWTQPIGFKYAGFEIAADALKRAQTLDKEKLRDAIQKTDLNTIVGPIKYNDKNFSETPLVGGQWVKGKKWPWELEIVYNKQNPHIKKTAEMIYPLPQ